MATKPPNQSQTGIPGIDRTASLGSFWIQRGTVGKSTSMGNFSKGMTEDHRESTAQSPRRGVLGMNAKLRELGAHDLVRPPQVVLIASEPSHSSFVLQQLTKGIVPHIKDWTRCPIQYRTARGDTWTCTVTIVWSYDATHMRILEADVQKERFGPEAITDKANAVLWVRRAQAAAVLKATRTSDEIKNLTLEKLDSLDLSGSDGFSRNVVQVDILDPHADDLVVVDLPGIALLEEKPELDAIRQKMWAQHSADSRSVILAIAPVERFSEFGSTETAVPNSNVFSAALAINPSGHRTIGLLIGAVDDYAEQESAMNTPPQTMPNGICMIPFHTNPLDDAIEKNLGMQKGVGIQAVWEKVEIVMRVCMKERLVAIRAWIQEELEMTVAGLSRIPVPGGSGGAHAAPAEILERTAVFCSDLRQTVDGEKNKEYAQSNRRRYDRFRMEILATAPNFYPFENAIDYPNPRLVTSSSEALSLNYVREVIEKSMGWEFPGILPFEGIKRIVDRHVAKWEVPSLTCFASIVDEAQNMLQTLLSEHFGQFPMLKGFIESAVEEVQREMAEAAGNLLLKAIKSERGRLLVVDAKELKKEERQWHKEYTTAAANHLNYRDDGGGTPEGVVFGSGLALTEEFGDELAMMAKVQSYFQIASTRYVDHIALFIETEFNDELRKRLCTTLYKEVAVLIASEGTEELLEEDPSLPEKRRHLRRRLEELSKLKDSIDTLDVDAPTASLEVPDPVYSSPVAPINLGLPGTQDTQGGIEALVLEDEKRNGGGSTMANPSPPIQTLFGAGPSFAGSWGSWGSASPVPESEVPEVPDENFGAAAYSSPALPASYGGGVKKKKLKRGGLASAALPGEAF